MTSGGQSRLILVGGGARSGKSRFALALAARFGPRRAFIATAQAGDDEMAARIASHQHERRGAFDTIESPLHPAAALTAVADHDVVILDCLTLWVSNLLCQPGAEPGAVERAALAAVPRFRAFPRPLILVSNEVGLGLVPTTDLGRVFRDVVGRLHQAVAREADEVYFAAMGLMLRLRPSPVEITDAFT